MNMGKKRCEVMFKANARSFKDGKDANQSNQDVGACYAEVLDLYEKCA